MKRKMDIVAFAIICFAILCSCNSAERKIQSEVKAANALCPISMANGLTTTSVEYDGMYVTYFVQGDDSTCSFSQNLVTDAMKDQLIIDLKNAGMADENVESFIDALLEKNVGIIYHYYTFCSSMDVKIEATELMGVIDSAECVDTTVTDSIEYIGED